MKIVAFAGGVGGAKLSHGLAHVISSEDLTIIVNTGDDFEHLGLYVCPDLDTVCYTLAGLANPETGWGRLGETWQAISNVEQLGGPAWFRLGDQDLGTHLERTRRLRAGDSISKITRDFCHAWGVAVTVLPMSDQPVATIVDTVDQGEITFQQYFVHQLCKPLVKGFRFHGINTALPAPGVMEAIKEADAVVFCPSNPWVSIDPILALEGVKTVVQMKPVVAISPLICGRAVKGPVAKICIELGIEPSALTIARHYGSLLHGFVIDQVDIQLANEVRGMGIQTMVTDILMNTTSDRIGLAGDVLNFIAELLEKTS